MNAMTNQHITFSMQSMYTPRNSLSGCAYSATIKVMCTGKWLGYDTDTRWLIINHHHTLSPPSLPNAMCRRSLHSSRHPLFCCNSSSGAPHKNIPAVGLLVGEGPRWIRSSGQDGRPAAGGN